MSVSENLKRLRTENGLTHGNLTSKVNVNRSIIAQNEEYLQAKEFLKFVQALGEREQLGVLAMVKGAGSLKTRSSVRK